MKKEERQSHEATNFLQAYEETCGIRPSFALIALHASLQKFSIKVKKILKTYKIQKKNSKEKEKT
jgi:hypothetical protein